MSDAAPQAKPTRNWWKWAFFVALLAFELAREWAVLASFEVATPATMATVTHFRDFTVAQGRWVRIGPGDAVGPGAVTIHCWATDSKCWEASYSIDGTMVTAPSLASYDATFEPGSVTYENDEPTCVHYSTRVDLKLQKVFAVRTAKEKPTVEGVDCRTTERRMDLTLENGYQADPPTKGHFVPLVDIIGLVSRI